MKNQKTAFYCSLKYRPSYVLNEQINIGLFFVLPEEGVCKLVFPKSLVRIKKVFPDAKLSFIKRGLQSRQRIAHLIKRKLPTNREGVDELIEELFGSDSVSIIFDKVNPAVYEMKEELFDRNAALFFDAYLY